MRLASELATALLFGFVRCRVTERAMLIAEITRDDLVFVLLVLAIVAVLAYIVRR